MKWIIALAVLSFAGCTQNPTQKQATTTPATPPSVASATTSAANPNTFQTPKISCKKGKDTRTLEVTQKAPGYLLGYEKSGKMTTVSKAPIGLNQCVQAEKRIQKKLEQAGFSCT